MVDAIRKHNFARQHMQAARYFADRAEEIENELLAKETRDEARKSTHRVYVVGAIVSAVMGLEACINEVYLEACDKNTQKLAGLDEQRMALLAEWWPRLEENRADVLLKYQHTLLLTGRKPMLKGQNPYQDTESLVRLRNALTHYKPEWEDSLDVHADLRSRLRGRFVLNRLTTSTYLWFPHQCLGGGCAAWAVNAVKEFTLAFCNRLGIPSRF